MKFEKYNFSKEIHKSLANMGFEKPTDIQYKTIPHVLKGEDVLAIAQTGTGKTAAFAIPIIEKLHSEKRSKRSEGIRCVVMVPTRELAMQIVKVFQTFARYTRVKAITVFGGVEQDSQIEELKNGAEILVATPGRLFDLNHQGYIDLKKTEYLILDEADHMLDLGFIKDIRDLIRFLPSSRQTLFFSATIDENIKKLAYSLTRKAIRIQISPKDPVSKNVDHSVSFIEMDDKRFFLEQLINEHPESKILVFVRTKVRAERVAKAMERVGIESKTIHGDKEQKQRLRTMEAFKDSEFKILIATDVSARGIDIPNVDYVVNYDLPDQAENYVHRVGRTGRGKNRGQAFSFCSKEERPILEEIESYLHKDIKQIAISKSDVDEARFLTNQNFGNWKGLMEDAEKEEEEWKKNKKKRKKKK